MTWYVNVNDLIGGWIVANVDLPLGDIDVRPPGLGGTMPEARVMADFYSLGDAERVARLLNWDEEFVEALARELRDP